MKNHDHPHATILGPSRPVSVHKSHFTTLDRLGFFAIILAFLALLWL